MRVLKTPLLAKMAGKIDTFSWEPPSEEECRLVQSCPSVVLKLTVGFYSAVARKGGGGL